MGHTPRPPSLRPDPSRSAHGRRKYSPLDIPNLVALLVYKDAIAGGAFVHDKTSPSSRNIVNQAPDARVLLTSWYGAGTRYDAFDGSTVNLSGYTNAVNNGKFTGHTAASSDIRVTNPAAVAETVGVGVGAAVVQSSGYAVSCVCRKTGVNFTSNFNLDRAYGYNTTISPSPSLCAWTNAAREPMAIASAALAGALNGTTPFTLFAFYRPKQIGVAGQETHLVTLQSPGVTSLVRLMHMGSSPAEATLRITGTGGTSTFSCPTLSPALTLNAWQLLAVSYTPGVAKFFVEAVQAGSVSATDRARSALDYTYVGLQNGTLGHLGVTGIAASAMTAADLVKVRDWCRAEYPAAA